MILYQEKKDRGNLLGGVFSRVRIYEIGIILGVIAALSIVFFTPNFARYFLNKPPEIIYSKPEGFYPESIELSLGTSKKHLQIRYTLNGSIPTYDSVLYEKPIYLDKSIVVRSALFDGQRIVGEITTNTYFINTDHTLPVISLTTDPVNLWDNKIGIYVEGEDMNFTKRGKEWERPVHIEYFGVDKDKGFEMDAGVRIHGNLTRYYDQKSLRICADAKYGSKVINYKLFPDRSYSTFKCILLRNSGNDWWNTLIRDAFISDLASSSTIEKHSYQPAVVYLNGEYWGIHNIREYHDDQYFRNLYRAKGSSVVLISPSREFIDGRAKVLNGEEGDEQNFEDLKNYIWENTLSKQDKFDYVEKQINMDNFIDYHLTQIFIANNDWDDANVYIWKLKTDGKEPSYIPELDGKWRWMLWDTDEGFGRATGVDNNTLAFATRSDKGWHIGGQLIKGSWPTLFLRSLLKNEGFKNRFINRYADLLNTVFLPERSIRKIDEMHDNIVSEIPNHAARWGNSVGRKDAVYFKDLTAWESEIQKLRDFATERPQFTMGHFVSYFKLSGVGKVNLTVSEDSAGSIKFSGLDISSFPKELIYFRDVPIQISAKANPGYKFVGWEGDLSSRRESAVIYLFKENTTIKAVFERNNFGKLLDLFKNEY